MGIVNLSRASASAMSRRQWLRSTAALTVGYLAFECRGHARAWLQTADGNPANVPGENIQYNSGSSKIAAYVSKPAGADKHPSVLVIHDDRGLDDHTCEVVRRFAAAGFYAMAPDLLSRAGETKQLVTTGNPAEALAHLSPDATAEDLRAGYAYLRETLNPNAGASAVGFGWGGWRTYVLASKVSGLSRAVVYSGSAPTSGLHEIDAPVLAHFGQFDFRLAGNSLWLEREMGKRFTYYVYPNVDHSFYDDSSSQFNEAAAKLAWSRTLEFLRSS